MDRIVLGFAGCGALGSWTAMMLAGNTNIHRAYLFDDDVVEDGNVATTVYLTHQVGATKVNALAELLWRKGVEARPLHGTVGKVADIVGHLAYHTGELIVLIDTFDNREARLLTRYPDTLHAGVSASRTGAVVWDKRWTPPPPSGYARNENPICTRHLGAQILQLAAANTAAIVRRYAQDRTKVDAPLILESGEVIR